VGREDARDWTFELYNRVMPGMPDAYALFRERLAADCPSSGGRLVDLGCGTEDFLVPLLEWADEIVGVDLLPLTGNYHRYIEANLNKEIPLEDSSADVVISRYALEHMEFPNRLFEEIHRVLRPGGATLLLTPNVLYYPYAINHLLSGVLNQKTRMKLVEKVSGRESDDIFPVFYGCNTPGRLRQELEGASFKITLLTTCCDCLVSAFNRPLGLAAIGYERLVTALHLNGAKGLLVAEGKKQSA
jgi:ubiquinone/menaquinone biosynthesis C-methylase UbiE